MDEYVAGATAAAAYRTISKSQHGRDVACRLLRRPDIAEAIGQRQQELIAEVGHRQLQVFQQLAAIARCDPRKLVDAETGQPIPLQHLDADTAAAIASVEVENISINGETGKRYKYRFWDKPKANDRAGVYLRMWDAPGTKVNIDQSSNTHNHLHVGSREALRSVADLGRVIAGIGASQSLPQSDQNGSVLPIALCNESPGHRASLDAGEDSGSSGAP